MLHLWHDLKPGRNAPEEITAVIEIVSGSRNKYELDKETGLLRLDRVLHSAVYYPAELYEADGVKRFVDPPAVTATEEGPSTTGAVSSGAAATGGASVLASKK